MMGADFVTGMTRVHLHFNRHGLAGLVCLLLAMAASAEAQPSRPVCVLTGVTVSQDATVLPGATIGILDAQGQSVTRLDTDEGGQFRIDTLRPGRYTVVGSLDGFTEIRREVVLAVGQEQRLRLELPSPRWRKRSTSSPPLRGFPSPRNFARPMPHSSRRCRCGSRRSRNSCRCCPGWSRHRGAEHQGRHAAAEQRAARQPST